MSKTITWSGHYLTLSGPRQITVSGTSHKTINVPPLKEFHIVGEVLAPPEKGRYEIEPDEHKRQSYHRWALPGAMDNATLRIYYRRADGTEATLQNGVDYEIVDPGFTGIKILNREVFDREPCLMDYRVRHQRVDVLAVNPAGELKMFYGHESIALPHWPLLPDGWEGIARIHSRYVQDLTDAALYPIADRRHARLINYEKDSDLAAQMPEDIIVSQGLTNPLNDLIYTRNLDYSLAVKYTAAQADKLRRRIAGQKKFTLVYFGDSVTQGGDVDKDRRWTFLIDQWLRQEYPGTEFTVINSAIGGTNSFFGRERFEKDVLRYRPDAVTIMFVLNDFCSDDDPILDNHRYFIRELDKIGALPIFITPNMNTETWMPGLDHATERIVNLAGEENRICVDVYALWKKLRDYGIPYETMLANGINHPDNIAAELFVEGLKKLMQKP